MYPTEKKKVWICPKDKRTDYKLFKRYPHLSEVIEQKCRRGMLVNHEIYQWLEQNIGSDARSKNYYYVHSETTVVFGFKTEGMMIKFINYIESV